MLRFAVFVVFLFSSILPAQTLLEGKVVDGQTGEPMLGVTVYISGSSKGTSTGPDGEFSINYPKDYVAPLVFSYIGYGTVTIDQPTENDLSLIQMTQVKNELDEVVLELDPWSREKKEKYFKEFFLGSVPAARLCEIRNIDKVRLRFNPTYNTLYASCDVPIIVDNKLLGYTILTDMADFEVNFKKVEFDGQVISYGGVTTDKNAHIPTSSFMAVSTYFKEMQNKKPSERKRRRNRKRLYKVSVQKFYKSLVSNSLDKDGFMLIYDQKKVEPKDHIRVREYPNGYIAEFRHNKYVIVDKKGGESFIQLQSQKIPFTKSGVLLTKDLLLGGYKGKLKLSGMLPLDYDPDSD